ncbi:MAG: FAD-dependent oxidoreductase [Leptolyngbyaceae cyanobacterium]
METLSTEVLVVGGGTGGTAAALQAARRGAQTILVSEGPWLGGMLTAAGVSAPDGNELCAFQTGIWGAFLRALEQRQPGGLDHGWVSFFTYEPRVGAAIFADWVNALPNLSWISGQRPRGVSRQGDRITGVEFNDFTVQAQITLDGTELGDLLTLGAVPHRWGWEDKTQWQEPSAPDSLTDPTDPLYEVVQRYPVQAPTWVVVMADYGEGQAASTIPNPVADAEDWASAFEGAWEGYGGESFLNYGRLPGNRFMINWPQQGNDYGVNLEALVGDASAQQNWSRAAIAHSQAFAHYIQKHLGNRYGLATDTFPQLDQGGGAFALQPYYRESRRLVGTTTITEQDLLPVKDGNVAPLPINSQGEMSGIAIGNYPNDHHYPGFDFPLAPKSLRWGGRWTGTPFTLPYEALVPEQIDGLLACDKNISVSHIANGVTRLQPTILGVGQAAGMAAALCVERGCQPRNLPVSDLQTALLSDPTAPVAIIPCFDLLPDSGTQQQQYCQQPESYPQDGYCKATLPQPELDCPKFQGWLEPDSTGDLWQFTPDGSTQQASTVVTLHPLACQQLRTVTTAQSVTLWGWPNRAGNWLRTMQIKPMTQ